MMGRECQQGLWLKDGDEEMEEINLALGSSPPLSLPREQDHLPTRDHLLPHLVPPPSPAAGGEKISA